MPDRLPRLSRRSLLTLGAGVAASLTLTGCLGTIPERELPSRVLALGGGFRRATVHQALTAFADTMGYPSVAELRLRNLTLTGATEFAITAQVLHLNNDSRMDILRWDLREVTARAWPDSSGDFFQPAQVPALTDHPELLEIALRDALADPIVDYSITAQATDAAAPALTGQASSERGSVTLSWDPATGKLLRRKQ